MNFGFDLEGTLDAEPQAFRALCSSLVDSWHEVYVITAYWTPDGGPDGNQEALRDSQLEAIGFVRGKDYTEMLFAPGSTVEAQGATKRLLCESHTITLMFEDRQVFTDEISKATTCLLIQPRI